MDVKELRDWINNHNVKSRAEEAFWVCFNNYMTEEPQDFKELFWDYDAIHLKIFVKDISLHIKSMVYFDRSNPDLEYIEVKVSIEYRTNHIGYYRLIFNLDGSVEDDYFISEWTGLRLYQTRALLNDIKDEIEVDIINGKITESEAIKLIEIIEEKKEKIRKELSQ